MARIRTIKPEFWTDETIVRLPFPARLLFIGLWNFADDGGALDYSPERIRLQVLPADNDIDITGMLDLLEAAGLIAYWGTDEDGITAITIKNWGKHQKIDNPSRKTILREGYRKRSILADDRVRVAKKYGCPPGGDAPAACYYCGLPGRVYWQPGLNGRPTRWIYLSELEFDHFKSEHSGGENGSGNMVLACRACNRAKREFDPHQFFSKRNSIPLASPREPSSMDQGSRIKDQGREGIKEISLPTEARPAADCADVQLVFDHWRETWAHPKSKLDDKRRRLIRTRLKDYSADELCEAIAGYRNSDFHNGVETGHTQDHIELFMRDSQHVDAGLKYARAGPRESKVTRINAENGRAWLQQEQALESERQRAIPDLDDGVGGNVYEGNFLKNQ